MPEAPPTNPDTGRAYTLREARCLFTRLKCEWLLWAISQGFVLAEDEGKVTSPRKIRLQDLSYMAEDAVHMKGSLHHLGLASDFLLYADLDGDGDKDDYVSVGGTEEWRRLGERWESMHELARWGGKFAARDDNHISLAWGGRR